MTRYPQLSCCMVFVLTINSLAYNHRDENATLQTLQIKIIEFNTFCLQTANNYIDFVICGESSYIKLSVLHSTQGGGT